MVTLRSLGACRRLPLAKQSLLFMSLTSFFALFSARASDLPNFAAIEQSKSGLRYSGTFEPNGEGRTRSVFQEALSLNWLAARPDPYTIFVNGKFGWLRPGPAEDLYDVSVGLTAVRALSDERKLGANVSYGSASDKPFYDGSVNTLGATVFYHFSSSPESKWTSFVNYSNNRPILNNIPLPGLVYSYTPSKAFRLSAGFPFAGISWEFAERWIVSAFTVVPWMARSDLAYRVFGPAQVFCGFDFSQQAYFRYGRSNPSDRIFFDSKRISAGIRSPLSRELFVALESGYVIARRLFEAESYTAVTRSNELVLGDAWFARINVNVSF